MSKAILVMDMPSSCDECNINGIFCGDVGDNDICRAGGCPLKELPQKKERENVQADYDGGYSHGITHGYNACIDEIFKGSEENG